MKLAGKIAIVSGGASGIGYAAAKVMLEAGATVGICDVNGERIEQAVKNRKSWPPSPCGVMGNRKKSAN